MASGGVCNGAVKGEASLPLQQPQVLHGNRLIRHGRTAHNMSSSSLRKKSDTTLVSKVPWSPLRGVLANLQEVFLGTKLSVLFPAIPLAIAADFFHFGSGWIFVLSLMGLIPLAERLSFITEQIACYTGATVGGLLNATCGNVTELIIALFALKDGKIEVLKCSLIGSVLSNLLLVLGSSLLIGGVSDFPRVKEQTFDRRPVDVGIGLLVLGVLCLALPLLLRYAAVSEAAVLELQALTLSRACSIAMLVAYASYVLFQLVTHRQMFESTESPDDDDDVSSEEAPVIGLASGVAWLVGMTAVIALLSDYVVSTIKATSHSGGLSVSFVSLILLPIVGNAAEHAGAVIFACKNKLDIALGVSVGSATQISMFVIPFSVVVAWITGIPMDLDFKVLETAALLMSVLLTSITLHDGTSNYMKGLVHLLAYVCIGACFFVLTPLGERKGTNVGLRSTGITS